MRFLRQREIQKKIIISRKSANLQITKFNYIVNIIIPFFNQHPILGMKNLDFEDFKKVSDLMVNKSHLTEEGLNKILSIKSNMNMNRE